MSLPPARRTRADRNDAVQQPMSWGTSPTRGDSMPRPWKVAKTDGAGQRAVGASEEQRLSLGSGHGSIVSFENEQANVAESTTNFWNALKMMTSSEKSNRSGGGCELPMPESASYSHSTPWLTRILCCSCSFAQSFCHICSARTIRHLVLPDCLMSFYVWCNPVNALQLF